MIVDLDKDQRESGSEELRDNSHSWMESVPWLFKDGDWNSKLYLGLQSLELVGNGNIRDRKEGGGAMSYREAEAPEKKGDGQGSW